MLVSPAYIYDDRSKKSVKVVINEKNIFFQL